MTKPIFKLLLLCIENLIKGQYRIPELISLERMFTMSQFMGIRTMVCNQ